MKEKELKDILRRDFNFDKNWKPLFAMLFSKVQYFSNPSNPFSENAKVVSGKQTGVVKLDDGKQLAIFEVEVDDSIRIDKNRQGLREIAIKHIDQNITHGAFVFFYSKYQKDYRFSFIARWSELDLETGEFRKGETKPKRYTYLLGDNEACTTAAKRLLLLAAKRDTQPIGIKDIIDAFSVESLNKEFFKTYKEHYERFWRFIANPENGYREILLDKTKEKPEQQEKPIRDFAKKLLGRIVFLHFLQKKGWMGCDARTAKWENGEKQFMQMLFSDFSDKAHFHSKCLTKLFFNTLNTRRNNDIFEIEGLNGKLNGSRVPYLNGGLFDTDKPEAVLTIDFPEKYFTELLDFFEQYNFTIDENSPDDHEVGIDPEMLGHIFENLLEENREKGAFYTPKEVVQYMCKESLIQYLNNHFDESVNVALFIRDHIISEKLAIPKARVSTWVEHIKLSRYQEKCLNGCEKNSITPARQKAVESNRKKYADLRDHARMIGFNEALGDPTHVAGVMLYWAEGSKTMNTAVFSNTDLVMQKQFKKFLDHLNVPKEKIKFSTTVHNSKGNATHDECRKFWSENLNISEKLITVYDAKDSRGDIQAKSRYPFGVGRIVVADYTVIQRIYGAIERYTGEKIPYGRK